MQWCFQGEYSGLLRYSNEDLQHFDMELTKKSSSTSVRTKQRSVVDKDTKGAKGFCQALLEPLQSQKIQNVDMSVLVSELVPKMESKTFENDGLALYAKNFNDNQWQPADVHARARAQLQGIAMTALKSDFSAIKESASREQCLARVAQSISQTLLMGMTRPSWGEWTAHGCDLCVNFDCNCKLTPALN